VLSECKQRLARLLLSNSHRSTDGVNTPAVVAPTRLPASAVQDFPPLVVLELEAKLLAHLLQFGTSIAANDVDKNAVVDVFEDSLSVTHSKQDESCTSHESNSVSTASYFDEPVQSAEMFLRSLRDAQQQQQQQHQRHYHRPNQDQHQLHFQQQQHQQQQQQQQQQQIRQVKQTTSAYFSPQYSQPLSPSDLQTNNSCPDRQYTSHTAGFISDSPQTECDVSSMAQSINSWSSSADDLRFRLQSSQPHPLHAYEWPPPQPRTQFPTQYPMIVDEHPYKSQLSQPLPSSPPTPQTASTEYMLTPNYDLDHNDDLSGYHYNRNSDRNQTVTINERSVSYVNHNEQRQQSPNNNRVRKNANVSTTTVWNASPRTSSAPKSVNKADLEKERQSLLSPEDLQVR
jgi:hypothetical protein